MNDAIQLAERLQRLQTMYDTTWEQLADMESRLADSATAIASSSDLQRILDRLMTIQPEYEQAVAIWNTQSFQSTTPVRQQVQQVQQSLKRLLDRTNELHAFADQKKTALLPQLGLVANQHKAKFAYQRVSDATG